MAIVLCGSGSSYGGEAGGGVANAPLGAAVVVFRGTASQPDEGVCCSLCDLNGDQRKRRRCRRTTGMVELGLAMRYLGHDVSIRIGCGFGDGR